MGIHRVTGGFPWRRAGCAELWCFLLLAWIGFWTNSGMADEVRHNNTHMTCMTSSYWFVYRKMSGHEGPEFFAFELIFKIRSETCRTEGQFCQNLYTTKKESLPDRPKFCRSWSAVRHLFWRLEFWHSLVSFDYFKPGLYACVNLVITGWGDGLSPVRRLAITSTNAKLLHRNSGVSIH